MYIHKSVSVYTAYIYIYACTEAIATCKNPGAGPAELRQKSWFAWEKARQGHVPRIVGLGSLKTLTVGPQQLPVLWSHIMNTAIVSYIEIYLNDRLVVA